MARAASGAPKRVVVWSTGGIGSLSIVAVDERPDLEMPLTISRHALRA